MALGIQSVVITFIMVMIVGVAFTNFFTEFTNVYDNSMDGNSTEFLGSFNGSLNNIALYKQDLETKVGQESGFSQAATGDFSVSFSSIGKLISNLFGLMKELLTKIEVEMHIPSWFISAILSMLIIF